jgi:aquaporin Z
MSEFFGTYLLALIIMSSGGNPLLSGGALGLIILLTGKISGGHVNPAVSLGFYLAGKLGMKEFATYVIFQLLGAAAAYYTVKMFA